jgi:hypothetical protein
MKTRLLVLVGALLLCIALQAQAQHRVYVGGQFGLGIEYQRKTDPADLVYSTNKRFGHSPYGVTMRYELDDTYGLEIGIIKEPYMRHARLRSIDFERPFEAGEATSSYVCIPIRLYARVLTIGSRAELRVFGGASHMRHLFDIDRPIRQGGGDFDQDALSYSKEFRLLKRYLWMLEGGTSLSYKLSNRFTVDGTINYLHGFNDLTRTDIRYKHRGRDEYQAHVVSKGSKLGFSVGLRYRVLDLRRLND